jgi:hypothetical protein
MKGICMRSIHLLLAVAIVAMLGMVQARADIEVSISQSGFSPSSVDYGELTTDYLTANLTSADPNVEIPIDGVSYQWYITSVKIDPEFGDNYQDADALGYYYDYFVELYYDEFQSCELDARIWADGNWLIEVMVVASYPDGYSEVFPQQFYVGGRQTWLADSYVRNTEALRRAPFACG